MVRSNAVIIHVRERRKAKIKVKGYWVIRLGWMVQLEIEAYCDSRYGVGKEVIFEVPPGTYYVRAHPVDYPHAKWKSEAVTVSEGEEREVVFYWSRYEL